MGVSERGHQGVDRSGWRGWILDQPGEQTDMWGKALSRGSVSKGQRHRQLSSHQSMLFCTGNVFPLFTSRQISFSLPFPFCCSSLCTDNETKCHAIPVSLLDFSRRYGVSLLLSLPVSVGGSYTAEMVCSC